MEPMTWIAAARNFSLNRFFDRVHSLPDESLPKAAGSILQLSESDPPDSVTTLLGAYLESIRN